jgi:hypothetical protein
VTTVRRSGWIEAAPVWRASGTAGSTFDRNGKSSGDGRARLPRQRPSCQRRAPMTVVFQAVFNRGDRAPGPVRTASVHKSGVASTMKPNLSDPKGWSRKGGLMELRLLGQLERVKLDLIRYFVSSPMSAETWQCADVLVSEIRAALDACRPDGSDARQVEPAIDDAE